MTTSTPDTAGPLGERERIVALDVLRGFALLGILIMNIQAFSMPGAAYTNPAAYGDLSGINAAVWTVSHVVADQKFLTIFSMLFGAGICLFSERAAQRTGSSTRLHYRRTFLLLVIGLLHAYFLFFGEILTPYALCAFWVYLLRNKRPKTLVVIAGLLLLVPTAIQLTAWLAIRQMPPEAMKPIAESWAPPAEELSAIVAGMRGTFLQQLEVRARSAVVLQTFVFGLYFGWRISASMLLGMALYKSGIVTGEREDDLYRRLAVVGLPLGAAISVGGAWAHFDHGFSVSYSMFLGAIPNYWGSLAMALGYMGVVMLAVRHRLLPRLQARLADVGRMAFTNYLAHSVIAWLIFNELGLFGAVARWQQLLIVVAIWALQIGYCPVWLRLFRYGPLEWLWRCATYGRLFPLKRT